MNIAIVGAGRQGGRHALSIVQTGLGKIHSIYDVDVKQARKLALLYGVQYSVDLNELLKDDISVVVIATPVATHYDLAKECLEAGKHIFCEKPLTINSKQAEHLAKIADAKGLVLQCAFIMRHHPAMKTAKTWIDNGRLGRLLYARCEYARSKNFSGTWRADRKLSGGGNLHDQAIHVVDLFRWYMGEFSEVQCYTTTAIWDMEPLEDDVAGVMRSEIGAVASFHVSYARWSPFFALEIGGEDALMRIEGLGNSDYGKQRIKLIERNDTTGLGEESESIEFFDPDLPWNDEWREFYEAVKAGRRPISDGYEGAQALKLVELLYESSNYSNARNGASK